MIPKARLLYEQLMDRIQDCGRVQGSGVRYLECCFLAGNDLVKELEAMLDTYSFSDESEEIEFFKRILPAFRGMVEYFSLVYFGQTCAATAVNLMDFWEEERQLVEKYMNKYQGLYAYYTTGQQDHDREWFVRRADAVHLDKFLEPVPLNSTPQSLLLAKLIAREKYLEFIQRTMETDKSTK